MLVFSLFQHDLFYCMVTTIMEALLLELSILWQQLYLVLMIRNLKKKILLTFPVGFFYSSLSNLSGISTIGLLGSVGPHIDTWFLSTNFGHASKNTSFYFWTLNGTLFCVIGCTHGFSCCAYWYAPDATLPLIMTPIFGSLGSIEILWIFWLGFGLGLCRGTGFPTFVAFHFTINCKHCSIVWSKYLQYEYVFVGFT